MIWGLYLTLLLPLRTTIDSEYCPPHGHTFRTPSKEKTGREFIELCTSLEYESLKL